MASRCTMRSPAAGIGMPIAVAGSSYMLAGLPQQGVMPPLSIGLCRSSAWR
jgi:hypothetical protein